MKAKIIQTLITIHNVLGSSLVKLERKQGEGSKSAIRNSVYGKGDKARPDDSVSDEEVNDAREYSIIALSLLLDLCTNSSDKNDLHLLLDNSLFKTLFLTNVENRKQLTTTIDNLKRGVDISNSDSEILMSVIDIIQDEINNLRKSDS